MSGALVLVVDINGPTMFELHRADCRDVVRARRRHQSVMPWNLVPGRTPAQHIACMYYGGDLTTVATTDWRLMPCV